MSTIWKFADSSSSQEAGFESASASCAAGYPYSDLMQKILALRGFQTEEEIQKFLFPSLEGLYDPFLMKGIPQAAQRILSAIERRETILIHGDYDVDGITGTAILSRTLEKLNATFVTFLPERKRDGYGVSAGAVRMAKEKNVSLFITVDCGITAFDETRQARASGMDVIIIDHHRIHDGRVPEANEIINPLQEGCQYPFKELSAGGLAFKLAQALLSRGAFEFLDLAALSAVCDLAPLGDENRILVTHGLEQMSSRRHLGFKSLCDVAKLKRSRLLASDLGFVIGPRINASGRLGSPDRALRLLTTNDADEARELAQALNEENLLRQKEDRRLLTQALGVVDREINFNRDKVVVGAGEGWHEGVIGIVAQRLVERFARPAVVISFDGELGKGSCRSVKGFHMFQSLAHCESVLEQFGGHELAAGLTIKRENFNAFRVKLNEYAQSIPPEVFCRSVRIDLEISFRDLSRQFLEEMSLLEPFGIGNPRPVFLTRGVRTRALSPGSAGKLEHVRSNALRWWVTDAGFTFEAVWQSRDPDIALPHTETYSIAYSPKLKSWEGVESVVLDIRDVKEG
ncbi:MAG: single-stranded-DNA-specific exonuclease RecJ [Omnitrophica bacterium RIFCSPLOWO2_12_FULL_50_11]|nr:MAG: single-stranded-DNA-specific exonuclease RecJ [Omnitrophica bacterium RIFCSPLOWO2_12_FULL_50_11]